MKTVTLLFAIIFAPVAWAPHEGMNMPDSPQQKTDPQQQKKDNKSESTDEMQMKDMPGMGMNMSMDSHSFIEETLHRGTSGTSAEPNSTPLPMLMTMKGKWMLMFH